MEQERVRAELEGLRWKLNASEERQQILAELGQDLVFDTDLATGQTCVFGAVQEVLGRPVNLEHFPQGEIGDGRCHPEDYPKLKQMMEEVERGESGRGSCGSSGGTAASAGTGSSWPRCGTRPAPPAASCCAWRTSAGRNGGRSC